MIRIVKESPTHVLFEKTDRKETWFDDNCSDENLLKILGKPDHQITRVQFDDGIYIGSELNVYLSPIHPTLVNKESLAIDRLKLKINNQISNLHRGTPEESEINTLEWVLSLIEDEQNTGNN